MPTHGSPAAARQANARARPRAGVSRPAHRPRPAQPSAPAPVQDPALTPPQNPDSYPHISPPPIHLGQVSSPAAPTLSSTQGSLQMSVWSCSWPGPPEVLQALYLLPSSPPCPAGFRVAKPPPCPHTCCWLSSSLLLPWGSLWVFAQLGLLTQVRGLLPPTPGTPS